MSSDRPNDDQDPAAETLYEERDGIAIISMRIPSGGIYGSR